MADSPPPVDLCGYEPPISLWSLVEKHVPPHEHEEVKNMLGASLVEQSLELHDEINLLLDIWRDYRDETMEHVNGSRGAASMFPEPPAQRERLKQEICFFVENIRDKARIDGRDPESLLSRHSPKVIDYALNRSAVSSRPSTALSRTGRETPMTSRGTPHSDRGSLSSTISEEVDSMSDKLNYLKVEEVVQHLRDTMEEEVEILIGDIPFLQSCLDDEANFRSESSMKVQEPTLAELKAERHNLQKDVQSLPPDIPSIKNQPSNRRLSGGLVAASAAKKISIGTDSPTRLKPMKASHNIVSPELEERNAQRQTSAKTSKSNSTSVQQGAAVISRGVLKDTEALTPTHVSIKTSKKPPTISAKPVKVTNIQMDFSHKEAVSRAHAPSPPSSKSRSAPRPSSATRFRNMVLSNRETS